MASRSGSGSWRIKKPAHVKNDKLEKQALQKTEEPRLDLIQKVDPRTAFDKQVAPDSIELDRLCNAVAYIRQIVAKVDAKGFAQPVTDFFW